MQIKPAAEENIKISLNTFKAPAMPLPPSPEPPSIQSQPEPINIPIPPEPVVTPPPPPPPVVVEPKPIPKPEPVKKVEPKPIKKTQEKKTPKKVEKVAKPVTEPIPPVVTQVDSTAKEPVAAVAPIEPAVPATTQQPKVSGTQTLGEFNFSSSSGDERFAKMQNAIKKHQKYPKKATKMRQQGVVEVSFFFKTNGTVTDVKVVKSSGFETLDEAAMEAIKKACKDFPILEKDYLIKIPMAYKLI
ncbi:energy transducer TonB [Campylobacter sp.]|uniref:energy transducer TonB n=1 Tax=Campylobacter sp. TaxID=205 RepID=UPI00403E8D63